MAQGSILYVMDSAFQSSGLLPRTDLSTKEWAYMDIMLYNGIKLIIII